MPILIKAPSSGAGAAAGNLRDMSWGEIAEISESGEAKNVFKVGDEIPVRLSGDNPLQIILQVAGFDHDDRADGGGKAGITFISKEAFLAGAQYGEYTITQKHWPDTALRKTVKAVRLLLPAELQAVIKDVYKLYGWNTEDPVQSVVDDIFVPSASELGIALSSNRYVRMDEGGMYELFARATKVIRSYSGTAAQYWTRSSRVNVGSGKVDFDKWFVTTSGAIEHVAADQSKRTCIMFCV